MIFFGEYYEDELLDAQVGSASSGSLPIDLTAEEQEEYLLFLKAKEQKRIRPGFYVGTEPREN